MISDRGLRQSRARHGLVVMLGVAALATGGLGAFASPLTAHAAPTTFYFHGLPGNGDDGMRTAGTPSATFDAIAPTGAAPSTQTSVPVLVPSACGDLNYSYWVGTAFTGPINGSVHIDWWWQTTNPAAIAQGTLVDITICADGVQIGHLDAKNLPIAATPTESTFDVPVSGTVVTKLLIQAAPHFIDLGQRNTVVYNAASEPSFFTIGSGPPPTPTPTPTITATPTTGPGQGGPQQFHSYSAPTPYPHVLQPPTGVALLFGEPSIGVDWGTTAAGSNLTMYQGDLNTWQVKLQYATGVLPTATWSDRSDAATDTSSLDARLIDDHAGLAADRAFVEQLHGATSAQAYTNTDGGTTTPNGNAADWIAGPSGVNGGADHESIAAGRYSTSVAPPAGAGTLYPHALYYCSQNIVNAAFCIRSDNGGVSYGPPSQILASPPCSSLHGKPRVGPDGTVYVPDKDCGGQKAVLISHDNGVNWTPVAIPGTTAADANQLDPDVAVGGAAGMGTVYYTYRDGNHHAYVATSIDDGAHWSTPVDIGSFFGIQNAQMTEVVAGDQNRAAATFVGTTCAGDDSVEALTCGGQPAVWYLYVGFTYDGGATWQVVNATPSSPVQRGGICAGGTGCPSNGDGSTSRNMLDFNDVTVDNQGRVEVAYTDGCTATCKTDPNGGTACAVPDVHADGSVCLGRNSSLFALSDQTCGVGLFKAFDPGFNNAPNCANPTNVPESPLASLLTLGGGAVALGAGLIALRRRRRRGPPLPA